MEAVDSGIVIIEKNPLEVDTPYWLRLVPISDIEPCPKIMYRFNCCEFKLSLNFIIDDELFWKCSFWLIIYWSIISPPMYEKDSIVARGIIRNVNNSNRSLIM